MCPSPKERTYVRELAVLRLDVLRLVDDLGSLHSRVSQLVSSHRALFDLVVSVADALRVDVGDALVSGLLSQEAALDLTAPEGTANVK